MSQASPAAANPRNNIADIYPLSPMQEGILFHTISAPGEGLYMPQTALRLSGRIDPEALKRAWQSAVDRHPVLRSGFYWEERDEPFQVVFRNIPLPWTQLDWSDAGEAEQQSRLSALLDANRAEPFDLHRPPLLRIQWARIREDQSILVACFHHLILDGWSVRQLFREALALYGRETGSAGAPLPASRPYGDFIGWLKKQDRQASLDFWADYLDGAPGQTRFLRLDATGHGFERRERECPAAVHRGLLDLCARVGCTMNTVLQAALGLLIARHTGSDDVVFGETISGRPATLAGSTAMIGLFINTLPVRVVIDPARPLGSWLAALQAKQAATMDHDHIPLREIQGSGDALFDTLLVVENFGTSAEASEEAPIHAQGVEFDERTHFPLTLWAMPRSDGLTLMAGYNPQSAASGDIEALLQQFVSLFEHMARQPEAGVGALLDGISAMPAGSAWGGRGDRPEIRPVISGSRAALETSTERLLAAAWSDVLKVPGIDGSSNFFDLGGHSLLAARVISRVRRQLAVEVPVRALFERPVLADLAAYIDALRSMAAPVPGHVEIEI